MCLATLAKLVWEMPFTEIAKRLGISDVAIRKRCKKLGIETPPQGYWLKSEVRVFK
jgi:DNA-binding Lrp family transcriptional regulator